MEAFLNTIYSGGEVNIDAYLNFARYAIPMLASILLLRCIFPLLTFRREPEIWGWLELPGKKLEPITHWENVIGRSHACDVVLNYATVSRNHAVLTRYDDGSWSISDAGSKTGVQVNGEQVSICAVEPGDAITVGGVHMTLRSITAVQEQRQLQLRTKAGSLLGSGLNLLALTVIQCMMALGFLLCSDKSEHLMVLQGFGGIIASQWLLLMFYSVIRRASFELETLAFFLCTLGMAAIASVRPGETVKQLIALGLGVLIFLFVGWCLRDLDRAKVFRYLAAVAGVGFLVATLLFGSEFYGAKNWLILGGVSLQPSELTKVCFVFVGASTMDRIMSKRNLILFILYSMVICGLLALMNDFGTALVFFCAFLIIAYLRSGSVGTVGLAITALVIACVLALRMAPHALRRFASWRHVWEDPFDSGYQQVQALMCLASGGLFGMGPNRGKLQRIFAADSDIAFATISEEWGLILAVMMVVCILAFGLFAIRTARVARSSFYTIGACTAAGILVIQASLNCLGTLDVLPFTGVTFPFLSNGGTGMIGAWGLLAFVKASDTRQDASFAVKQAKQEVTEDA